MLTQFILIQLYTALGRKRSSRKKKPLKMKNKPNGLLSNPHSKLKNEDFACLRIPFCEKQTQWYVIW